VSSSAYSNWFEHRIFSPEGTFVVAAIGGFINGLGNLIGGLRWNKRAKNVSDEENSQIQEAGWLLCSAESFVFSFSISVWGYAWLKRQGNHLVPSQNTELQVVPNPLTLPSIQHMQHRIRNPWVNQPVLDLNEVINYIRRTVVTVEDA
jgi:hypothetical protein